MNKQILKVVYYIETHLYEDLDLVKLAEVASYSPFHFCRVFKIHVGESVMSYVTRLKLQKAAIEVKVGKKSMINIALDADYETPTGFLKAFKKQFGVTPTDFRQNEQKEFNSYKDIDMNTPKIITRQEVSVVFVREMGDYGESGKIAWKKLGGKMNNLNTEFEKQPLSIEMNLGKGKGEALGLCHDDPKVTQEDNIRYDAALAWGKAEVAELSKYGFETKNVAGGRYVKLLSNGGDNVNDWYGLYAWIDKKGYTFRDVPPFEKYLNALEEVDREKILVEIYVPIEE